MESVKAMFERLQRKSPLGFIEPCLPTASDKPRTGPEWVHEIKFDGYRLLVRREGDRVRLFTRRGHDWTKKYPRIVDAARKLKARSFLIDGEAVWCGPDGVSDFEKLHSQAYNDTAFLYGFDLLQLDGEDWREHHLAKRKAKLQRLLIKSHGIRYSEHLEGDGAIIFEHVANSGPKGSCPSAAIFPTTPGARGAG
jgi:bifunctional non-homologous end joining protein LigD